MRRLHPVKIDDAKYYEKAWTDEITSGKGHFDAVRQRFLAHKVEAGDIVIDLGAGVHGTAQFICQVLRIPDVEIIAYDQSYTARDIVLQRCPGMRFDLGELPDTPYEDNFFDCVFSGEVIEHMEEPQDLVDEMVRICKPGGWITLTTVNTNCEQAIAHGDYPEHLWEFTVQDLVVMFIKHGLVEYQEVGNYHAIIFRKRM